MGSLVQGKQSQPCFCFARKIDDTGTGTVKVNGTNASMLSETASRFGIYFMPILTVPYFPVVDVARKLRTAYKKVQLLILRMPKPVT